MTHHVPTGPLHLDPCRQESAGSEFSWQVREMAACGLQLVDRPDGFASAAVVPFLGTALKMNCALLHLSNKYCDLQAKAQAEGKEFPYCSQSMHNFLIP